MLMSLVIFTRGSEESLNLKTKSSFGSSPFCVRAMSDACLEGNRKRESISNYMEWLILLLSFSAASRSARIVTVKFAARSQELMSKPNVVDFVCSDQFSEGLLPVETAVCDNFPCWAAGAIFSIMLWALTRIFVDSMLLVM